MIVGILYIPSVYPKWGEILFLNTFFTTSLLCMFRNEILMVFQGLSGLALWVAVILTKYTKRCSKERFPKQSWVASVTNNGKSCII